MNDFLNQMAPWSLTYAQTLVIGLIALVLLLGLGVMRFFMRISGMLFQLGCAVVVLGLCGFVTAMVIANLKH